MHVSSEVGDGLRMSKAAELVPDHAAGLSALDAQLVAISMLQADFSRMEGGTQGDSCNVNSATQVHLLRHVTEMKQDILRRASDVHTFTIKSASS